jgi:hypothetical protein
MLKRLSLSLIIACLASVQGNGSITDTGPVRIQVYILSFDGKSQAGNNQA